MHSSRVSTVPFNAHHPAVPPEKQIALEKKVHLLVLGLLALLFSAVTLGCLVVALLPMLSVGAWEVATVTWVSALCAQKLVVVILVIKTLKVIKQAIKNTSFNQVCAEAKPIWNDYDAVLEIYWDCYQDYCNEHDLLGNYTKEELEAYAQYIEMQNAHICEIKNYLWIYSRGGFSLSEYTAAIEEEIRQIENLSSPNMRRQYTYSLKGYAIELTDRRGLLQELPPLETVKYWDDYRPYFTKLLSALKLQADATEEYWSTFAPLEKEFAALMSEIAAHQEGIPKLSDKELCMWVGTFRGQLVAEASALIERYEGDDSDSEDSDSDDFEKLKNEK